MSPENILVFVAGPLVGTIAPASCRVSIGCKNVLTGGGGAADAAGYFAPEMKNAGYDSNVITGKGGTHYLAGAGGPNSTSPQSTRNFQDEFWPKEKSEKIKEHVFKPNKVKRLACFNCPVRCSHL